MVCIIAINNNPAKPRVRISDVPGFPGLTAPAYRLT
jgi:hypothetical protein